MHSVFAKQKSLQLLLDAAHRVKHGDDFSASPQYRTERHIDATQMPQMLQRIEGVRPDPELVSTCL